MIYVKVSYTVKPEFAPKNQDNIQAFLTDFRQLDPSGFRYEVFTLQDGITFLHLSSYVDQTVQHKILNTASFLEFQKQRDQSGLDGSHKVEILNCIGHSKSW